MRVDNVELYDGGVSLCCGHFKRGSQSSGFKTKMVMGLRGRRGFEGWLWMVLIEWVAEVMECCV